MSIIYDLPVWVWALDTQPAGMLSGLEPIGLVLTSRAMLGQPGPAPFARRYVG